MRVFTHSRLWIILTLCAIAVLIGYQVFAFQPTQQTRPHNAVIFVADGLRPSAINAKDTPTLYEIRQAGVTFSNSHSLFPTFTTANASAIATGHYLGDTGDFSNTIKVKAPVKSAKNSLVPFLENNAVLQEVNQQFNSNFLNEESLLAIARKSGFSTAAVGKIGPVLIQDVTQATGAPTIIFDDATGTPTGIPLSPEITNLLTKNSLALATPSRGDNGKSGDSKTPGTKSANTTQQQYFIDVTTQVILPLFKQRQKPFVLVYWSRDPDGTQHNHGDSLNQLVPGINGPTVQAALQNVDKNLNQIRTALQDLGLDATTNLFVTSDHGFSTISKESKTSYAASLAYAEVPTGFLPPGFLAIDLAEDLQLSLFNPDNQTAPVNPTQGQFSKNSILAKDPTNPDIIIAGNGGSDLLYLLNAANNKKLHPQGDGVLGHGAWGMGHGKDSPMPGACRPKSAGGLSSTDTWGWSFPPTSNKAYAKKIIDSLLKQDYVSGIFVDDTIGKIPGTLPLSAIQLRGTARTPIPSIVVNFRSFDTGCGNPTACGADVADTTLQQGQGMHGSFSRADTYNTMAAIGPDFKQKYQDQVPVGNADVAPTLAKVLNLKLPAQGKLVGRVLNEALRDGPNKVKYQSQIVESQAAANGLKTILKYQTVGKTRYFDTAGFPGRTLGL